MSKLGTLVLYDSENMKVPSYKKEEHLVFRIDMKLLRDKICERFNDVSYHFIAFSKRYPKRNDKRNKVIDQHNEMLRTIGFTIVEKTSSKKSNVIIEDGARRVYEYEECDMDGEIIHTIHTLGPIYSRVILLSGDKDMKTSLDYIREHYGVEIWVISHKERLSNEYSDSNVIELHELLWSEK